MEEYESRGSKTASPNNGESASQGSGAPQQQEPAEGARNDNEGAGDEAGGEEREERENPGSTGAADGGAGRAPPDDVPHARPEDDHLASRDTGLRTEHELASGDE